MEQIEERRRLSYLMELSLKGKIWVERVTYRSQIASASARRSRARRSQEIELAE
jgi:hypothetical protein